MGSFCSIFHSRFKKLRRLIPSARKAQLMDYILLGWQSSTYKLKGSDNKWFMKPYNDIVADTGIPRSTLERYIKELDNEGFIERRQALYGRRRKKDGVFDVRKGAYISITNHFLALLLPSEKKESIEKQDTPNASNEVQEQLNKNKTLCSDLEKNEGIDPLKMRGLYIRDLYTLFLDNIIFKKSKYSVDKTKLPQLIQQFKSIRAFLYSDIKEELPYEVKNQVLGTFFNLTFQHQKQFSSPKQIAAEYVFALLNYDFYLPHVTCLKHRTNILAKLLRTNAWHTPKGFYKHFYLGQDFKDKQHLREQQWQDLKAEELKQSSCALYEDKKENPLSALEAQMFEKGTLIKQLKEHLYQQSSEEVIETIQRKIQVLRTELEELWRQQSVMEQELAFSFLNKSVLCA